MPFAVALLILDVMFVWHAAKTGRMCPWAYIILAIPGFGVLAYVAIELAPEWLGSIEGQKAQARIGKSLNPEKRYRSLVDNLIVADTVANRVALGHECLALGRFAEAKKEFETVIARPQGDEPAFYFAKARAEFGLDQPAAAIATLDALRELWPDFQSAEAHMLYARSLEQAGREREALAEYRALAEYHSSAEARVRMGLLMERMGRTSEARALFAEVIAVMQRQPKFVRKVQAEWIALAEKALGA